MKSILIATLAAVAMTGLVAPAFADDHHDRDRHDRHRPVHYAPPPRARYAPPVVYSSPPPVAPGLSLMFNFR